MSIGTGRIALVTGASQGIGRACALELARQGATVALAARNVEKLGEVAAEIRSAGGTAEVFGLDVGDEASIKACGKAVIERFGRIEILVNNAGITRDGLSMRMRRPDWDDVLTDESDGGVSDDAGGDAFDDEGQVGADCECRVGGGGDGAGGAGELCGFEGGADRPDEEPGAGAGEPVGDGECGGPGVYRDGDDGGADGGAEVGDDDCGSAGPSGNRCGGRTCGGVIWRPKRRAM